MMGERRLNAARITEVYLFRLRARRRSTGKFTQPDADHTNSNHFYSQCFQRVYFIPFDMDIYITSYSVVFELV